MDDFRSLADLLNAILAPMYEIQNKQSNALVLSSQQIQRLADMLQSEPTRKQMLDAIDDIVSEHTDVMDKKTAEILTAVLTALTQHNDNCKSRNDMQTERSIHRDSATLSALKELIENAVYPSKVLTEKWDRIKWEVRIYFTIASGLAGWIIWLYHNVQKHLTP